jgi:dipeptidyl aminopeptidase/acylaminoacyl peptidase
VSVSSPSPSPSASSTTGRALATVAATIGVGLLTTTAASAGVRPAPDVEDRPGAPGPAAQIAWVKGRDVLVAPDAGTRPGRVVARLRAPVGADGGLALSRDGRNLVVITTSGTWVVPVSAGGRPTRLGDSIGQGESGVRWSPDGRQVLLVTGDITACTVEPTVACRRVVRGTAVDELGASWSPDGARFAYVRRHPSKLVRNAELGDLVTVDAAGGGTPRVVERATFSRRRLTYPVPPVWTSAGLVWSSYSGPRDAVPGRVRTRILQADGRVHTLTAGAAFRGRTVVSFLASGETPTGQLLGTAVTRTSRNRYRFALTTLGLDGALHPYGVSFPASGGDSRPLGVLADGRVAVTVTGDDSSTRQKLYLLAPGSTGLGTPVVTGPVVSAAVAHPDETRGF